MSFPQERTGQVGTAALSEVGTQVCRQGQQRGEEIREGSETKGSEKSPSIPERDIRCHPGLRVKERKGFQTCPRFLMTSVILPKKHLKPSQSKSFLYRGDIMSLVL